ncbi:Hypothetical predicted protein [Octopus vulgaris]|uniref:Uncharacterized protein n=1 Tax=Octopus vulgaris TaxID=6645 RepID=A0AA36BSC3_OCTVU|nr:Hypothetical predicted protein [Octopus vulgaris]
MATKNYLELHERTEHNGNNKESVSSYYDINAPQHNGYSMGNWIPHGELDITRQTGYRSSDSGRPCSSWTEEAQDIPIVVVTPQDLERNNHNSSNGNSIHVLVGEKGSPDLNEDSKDGKVHQNNGSSADETQDEDMMKYFSNKRQSHKKKGQSSKSESRDFESQTAEDKIINSIKLQKELIDTIRFQPWNIHKKLKYLRKAKAFVKGHESSLSRRQDFQRMGFDAFRRIQRELMNAVSIFIPWEMQIKRVEGHFGSVVASYFLFLRWLLWVNTILTLLTVAFIILPQVIAGEKQAIPESEVAKSGDLDTLIAAEESIREVEEKEKVEKKKLLIFLRCLGVLLSLFLYGLSGYLTYYIVTTSESNPNVEKSYFEANATTWVITGIHSQFPQSGLSSLLTLPEDTDVN